MSKQTSKNEKRIITYQFYYNKFYNLWMNSFKLKGIEKKQQDYILRKFWATGAICAFIVEGTKFNPEAPSVNSYPDGMIAFAQFTPKEYDINDYPINADVVQSRGATFMPSGTQPVDTSPDGIVIGYIQRNKKSISTMITPLIDDIVDIEMTIKNQLLAHKTPWLIATTPENEKRLKRLFERIEADEPVLYITAEEIEALKTLNGGNTYIIDKLYQYKEAKINEALTFLGKNNVGGIEKKEHLVVDEVNSNNQVIAESDECFSTCIDEFCEKVRDILRYPLELEKNQAMKIENVEDEENEEDDEDENM